jgi:hypothetical protein
MTRRYEEQQKTPEELQAEHDASAARWLALGRGVARVMRSALGAGLAASEVVKKTLAPKVLFATQVATIGYIAYDVAVVAQAASPDLRLRQGVQQACFQLLSAVVLPAIALRFAMPRFVNLFSSSMSTRLRKLGPLGLGLACVATFPFIVDVPTKSVTENAMMAVWPVSHEHSEKQ